MKSAFLIFTVMKKEIRRNAHYIGADERESLYDLYIPEKQNGAMIVFIHGYMGFKDWGCWNLVADFFTDHGYAFLKYNVSHNGCTVDQPTVFADLDAFSKNSYSKELVDLGQLLQLVRKETQFEKLFLIGHSRGGGIALLQAQNEQISGICTWAAIASIEKRFPVGAELEQWQKEGVRYVNNQRTGQRLPLLYQQYESFLSNRDHLDIERSSRSSTIPVCVIHGSADEAVPLEEAYEIAKWIHTTPQIIQSSGHTFGSMHPWEKNQLPSDLNKVCQISLEFFDELSKKRSA